MYYATKLWRAILVAITGAILLAAIPAGAQEVPNFCEWGDPRHAALDAYLDKHKPGEWSKLSAKEKNEWIARTQAYCQQALKARQRRIAEEQAAEKQKAQEQSEAIARLFKQDQEKAARAQAEMEARRAQQQAQRAIIGHEYSAKAGALIAQTISAGYEPMTVESFVLDAKALAASGKKVAVLGNYWGERLCNERTICAPLITYNAGRELRRYLMTNWDAMPRGMFGQRVWSIQDMVLLGQAVEYGRGEVCLSVVTGWRVQRPEWLGTLQSEIPAFVPPEWPK